MATISHAWRALIGGCLCLCMGCAAKSYQYSRFHPPGDPAATQTVAIEYGAPNKTLDRIGRVVGFPARIFALNCKVNNHEMSEDTIDKLKTYLAENDLNDVRVFVNHYDPARQWKLLRDNQRIAPGWKYTAGMFRFLGYTLLPGRVFGGDQYNPYTDSLYLNSDVPSMVLREAALAKDVRSRTLPGTYSAFNDLPVVGLWRTTLATSDALAYAREQEDWEVEREGYCVLYPQLGMETVMAAGGPFLPFFFSPVLGLGGAACGHACGRTVAAMREREMKDTLSPIQPPLGDESAPAIVRLPEVTPTSEVQQASFMEPVD